MATWSGHEQVGHGLHHLLRGVCPQVTDQDFSVALDAFSATLRPALIDETAPYLGIQSCLDYFAAHKWRQAVVTNKPTRFAERIIAHLGWRHLFVTVIGGDQAKKPDPSSLEWAMNIAGASAERTIMIGDHLTDLAVATAVSCRSGWCQWGIGHAGDESFDWSWQCPNNILEHDWSLECL